MINYFIGVFGACVALYGALILSIPFACALIALFLLIVSMLFYKIDIRNKFDVKQSQEVLCMFEKKYELPDGMSGAFLHEENTFILYDRHFRKNNQEYKAIFDAKNKLTAVELDREISQFVRNNPDFSAKDVKGSLFSGPIPHLSTCIKALYYICMAISVLGMALAFVVFFIK